MYSKKFIGLEEARAVAEAVLVEASKSPGRPVAAAVVDPVGQLIYLVRQDDTLALSSNMATNKAYTAITLRQDTAEVDSEMKTDISNFCDPRLTRLPGGVCLRAPDGTIIGAIGVSGRRRGERPSDKELAEAGAKALVL